MGRLDTTGMSDRQIDTVMQWQARADRLEVERNDALLLLARERSARDTADENAEKWKQAALLRDHGASVTSGALRDHIERLIKEKAVIVEALRKCNEALSAAKECVDGSTTYYALDKTHKETAELLSIIDGLNRPPRTPT